MSREPDKTNSFINQFHDKWEQDANFRATWSTLGAAAFLIIFITATVLGTKIVSGILSANSASSNSSTGSSLSGQVANMNPTFAVPPYTPQANSATPPSYTIVTPVSGTALPATATPPPFLPTPTPSVAPTVTAGPGDQITVTANQNPNIWTMNNGNNNKITNVSTSPAAPNAQVSISLDFGNSCIEQVNNVPNTDNNGQINQPITIQLPSCFTNPSLTTVNATFTINGSSSTVQFQAQAIKLP